MKQNLSYVYCREKRVSGSIKTETSRGEESRYKTQENSPVGSQVDLGFSDRNLRKNGYVKSKEDASLIILLLNACSPLNKFDEVITLSVSHKPHIIAITEFWLHDKILEPRDRNQRLSFIPQRGGGALLLIRSSLRPKQKIQPEHDGTPLTDVERLPSV